MTESMFISPPPVTLAGLRSHFLTTYGLKEDQVELMVNSSRRSLEKIFNEAREAMGKDDVAATMVGVCHSLKGLLLNMGEPDWADMARMLEKAARDGKPVDFKMAMEQFHVGMTEVLAGGDSASEQ